MEREVEHEVLGRPRVRSKVYLAAQRFKDLMKQFKSLTPDEQQICLQRIEELAPSEMDEFYKALVECKKATGER